MANLYLFKLIMCLSLFSVSCVFWTEDQTSNWNTPLSRKCFYLFAFVTHSWRYRIFTLWRQKAASRPLGAVLPGLLSSNLPGGALEVCHAEVGGWRGSEREQGKVCAWERERFVCVCFLVKQQGRCVWFRCPEWENPRLDPVWVGIRPSAFWAQNHRPEGVKWDLEPKFAFAPVHKLYNLLYEPDYTSIFSPWYKCVDTRLLLLSLEILPSSLAIGWEELLCVVGCVCVRVFVDILPLYSLDESLLPLDELWSSSPSCSWKYPQFIPLKLPAVILGCNFSFL